jgi:hypothetical protein
MYWKMKAVILMSGLVVITVVPALGGQWELELETGPVFSGYNDVQIPGDTGTRLSLVDDLETEADYFFRAKLIRRFNRRHSLGLLVAPLTLQASGRAGKPVTFEGVVFPADSDLEATYRFDSYRLTYGYSFYPNAEMVATVGFTAKIRDAAVRLESETQNSEKTNTGFVPLLHLRLLWTPGEVMSLIFEADALAAPQGRAEDAVFALQYAWKPAVTFRFGYRLLEGGADNEEVYNFTLLNYVVVGTVIRF